jgi:hypothetical protein
MARKKAPGLRFQDHIAAFLVREHQYGVLEQTEGTHGWCRFAGRGWKSPFLP